MKKIIMLATAALFSSAASAQQIVAPASATINAGGPGFGSINDTINQNGLSAGYTSGITNFDAYIASAPSHSSQFSTFEWFSQRGSTSATVTYDLGSLLGINAMALWNEEGSGIGSFNLLTSADGVNFVAALLGVSPINNLGGSYLAQVFNFDVTASRYARLEMSGCPQSNSTFDACAIGEVAFRTAAVTAAVPEPATWAMMLLGFGAIGVSLRRRRRTQDILQTA